MVVPVALNERPNWRPTWREPQPRGPKREHPPQELDDAKMSPLERYDWLDAKLVANGWPATSPWWREQIARWIASGKRQLVGRVGRRGGKSSTMCRLAVVLTLWGSHAVPPGDVGYASFVSTTKEEASERLRTIQGILGVLGYRWEPIAQGRGLTIPGARRGFRVFAASISGVSGFTCVFFCADEVAKWRDADTGANPAREVLASARPTMATQPEARMVLISSPLGRLDAHAAAYEQGETDYQIVAHAPSWVANPTLTEEGTRREERVEDIWRREYAAIPLEGDEQSLFTPAMLDKCTRPAPDVPIEPGVTYVAAMDPGMARNAWTFGVAAQRLCADGRVKRSIVYARELRGTRDAPLQPDVVLGTVIAPVLARYGINAIYSDQYEKFGLAAIAERHGVSLFVPTRTAPQRIARYEWLVTQMLDGEIELPPHPQLRADMLSAKLKLTPNGWTVNLPVTPDGRHADYVPMVMLALDVCDVGPVLREATLSAEERGRQMEREMEEAIDRELLEDDVGDAWDREFRRRGY